MHSGFSLLSQSSTGSWVSVDFGLECSIEIRGLGRGAHFQPPAHQVLM